MNWDVLHHRLTQIKFRKYSIGQLVEQKKVIFSLGMNRAGSTWAYNALRLILSQGNSPLIEKKINCGWIEDTHRFDNKSINLIKAHDISDSWISQSVFSLYTYRDIRSVLLSLKVMFNVPIDMSSADYLVDLDSRMKKHASLIIRFEEIKDSNLKIIEKIAKATETVGIDSQMISKELQNLNYQSKGPKNGSYNLINLLHKNHITHSDNKSFEKEFGSDLLMAIEQKHQNWFEENNYPETLIT